MTQAELEWTAREMRGRGLNSSWEELLIFSEDVVGSLVSAYQALLKRPEHSSNVSQNDPDDTETVIRDKLAKSLILLTSEAHVAQWKSEALAGNSIVGTQG